jgi:hypothetical protein
MKVNTTEKEMEPHMSDTNKKTRPAAIALLLLLCVLALAACGGSSTSSSTTSSTAASAATPAGGAGRFAAVRECLQKNGITLPPRPSGQGRPPGAGGLLGGGAGPQLPKGVTRAQYEAALKKCGAGKLGGGGARLNSPAYRQALSKFAACMRENGVSLPAPNTSGNGPVFNTKGLSTTSSQFRSAQSKCQPTLVAARGQGGPGVAPPGAGSPGAGPPAAG